MDGDAPITIRPLATDQRDEVLALIVGQQADPTRHISALGVDAAGVSAELDDLDPDWTTIVHVACAGDRIVGAIVTDLDDELGKAWLAGPWVDGDDAGWATAAPGLLDAALEALDPGVTRIELAGNLANTRLAELAATRGWAPTQTVHALTVDAATVATWPDELDEAELRTLTVDDLDDFRALHDAEFPSTYAPPERIVADVAEGTWTSVVARRPDGAFAGYAAGRVQADGEGYLDYVAVTPEARGTGVGRRLVVALSRRLVARSTTGTASLTVDDERSAARALYAGLGFRTDLSFRGYRGERHRPA